MTSILTQLVVVVQLSVRFILAKAKGRAHRGCLGFCMGLFFTGVAVVVASPAEAYYSVGGARA